jgi:hypothetical protein
MAIFNGDSTGIWKKAIVASSRSLHIISSIGTEENDVNSHKVAGFLSVS